MPWKATKIELSQRERTCLESITRRRTESHHLIQRAKIILLASAGESNSAIGPQVDLERHQVGVWRKRWAQQTLELCDAEVEEVDLESQLLERLEDLPRSGGPVTFTAEQVTRIIVVACEPPEDSGRPVTHWSPRELADEVVKRGIVESISVRHCGRFLKRSRLETALEPILA